MIGSQIGDIDESMLSSSSIVNDYHWKARFGF